MGEMGLLGVTVPEERGGLGLGYLEHTIAMEGESFLAMGVGE
jgi:isovaleryl-CoA dehydrogenase